MIHPTLVKMFEGFHQKENEHLRSSMTILLFSWLIQWLIESSIYHQKWFNIVRSIIFVIDRMIESSIFPLFILTWFIIKKQWTQRIQDTSSVSRILPTLHQWPTGAVGEPRRPRSKIRVLLGKAWCPMRWVPWMKSQGFTGLTLKETRVSNND